MTKKKMTESERRAEQRELKAAMKQKIPTVADFSDAELRAELAVREKLAAQKALEVREARAQLILDNVDTLLLLVMAHDTCGCSDLRPDNATGGTCTRCVLIDARDNGCLDVYLDLQISFNR